MDTSVQSKARLGLEKQEHLVKLAILTTAAILCKSNTIVLCLKFPKKKKIPFNTESKY